MRQLVFASLVTLGLTQTSWAQNTGAWADKLFSGVTTHDFGVVARGSQLKHQFKMTNIYKVPLNIMEIRVSCGCVTASSPVKVLQPNESADLLVNMDGRQFNGSKQVRVFVTVGPQFVSTATLTVTANATQDIAFTPTEIDFGTLSKGQTISKSVDVLYSGPMQNWTVNEIVKSATAPFDLKVDNLPAQATGQFPQPRGYRVTATIKADAPSGPFKQEIVLKTTDPAHPNLTYHINGSIQNALTVFPSSLSLSGLHVGEQQTKKLLVRGSRPFRITKVEGQGEGVTVDIPNREETTIQLSIHIQPGRTGELHRQLVIHTDLENETAVIQVDGEVTPP